MRSVEPQLFNLPDKLGMRRAPVLMTLLMLVGGYVCSQITTQYIASSFHFSPYLGHAWIQDPHLGPIRSVYLRALYNPLSFLSWFAQFCNPFGYRYPESVHVIMLHALIIGFFSFSVTIVASVTTDVLVSRDRDREVHLHDSGHWATYPEMKQSGVLTAKAGPIIGGYEVPGTGIAGRFRKIVPARYDGELGIEGIAAPGEGKTAALLKTNLLIRLEHADAPTWSKKKRREHPWGYEPSKILLDVKSELRDSTSGCQERLLDAEVIFLEPFRVNPNAGQYNPFSSIRLGTPFEYDDCYGKALDIVDRDGKGLPTHWDKTSLSFLAAWIAKLGWRAYNTGNLDYFTLPGLLDALSSRGDIDDLCNDLLIVEDDPAGVFGWVDFVHGTYTPSRIRPAIASAAREMAAKAPAEKSGVHATALSFLSLYRSEILRKSVMRSTFEFHQIPNGRRPRVVYVCIPPMKLKAAQPYLRMLTNDAFRSLSEEVDVVEGRSVRPHVRSTIVALDEVATLKYMEELESGSGFFRGYGVMLWLFWQSVYQKFKRYTENDEIGETMDVFVFGRPRTHRAARYLSELLGKMSSRLHKRSASGKRLGPVLENVSESVDVNTRDLLTPSEARRLDRNYFVVIYKGLSMYLRKFDYWRSPMLLRRSLMRPVKRSAELRDPNAPIVVPRPAQPRTPPAAAASGVVAGVVAQGVAQLAAVPPATVPPAAAFASPANSMEPAAASATAVAVSSAVQQSTTSADPDAEEDDPIVAALLARSLPAIEAIRADVERAPAQPVDPTLDAIESLFGPGTWKPPAPDSLELEHEDGLSTDEGGYEL